MSSSDLVNTNATKKQKKVSTQKCILKKYNQNGTTIDVVANAGTEFIFALLGWPKSVILPLTCFPVHIQICIIIIIVHTILSEEPA